MEEIDAGEKTSTLQENKPTVNVEIMANTGSHVTDHNNPTSVEYDYIDDIPDSAYQQAMEENQPEAENDYECIAETNPGYDYIEPINDPRTFSERKCKRGIVFLVPIFAGVIVNFIAGLFFTTFPLQLTSIVGWMVFIVVNALAAAFCAPLMIRYDFRKVAFGGSVLLFFSCISSSLTTRDYIKTVTTFIIMKSISAGLLRATGVVATVDYLNTRPTLAIIISYFSFIIGSFSSLFVFIRSTKWLEISALLGLVAALFLQKNSQTHVQNVTKLFKHPPFYVLVSITVVCSMGMASIVNPVVIVWFDRRWTIIAVCGFFVIQMIVLVVLLVIRNFLTVCLKRSALLSMGLSAVGVGVVIIAHKATHPVSWGVGIGFAFVLSQVMLPIALISTTERNSLKLALPLLSCFHLTGLVGGVIIGNILEDTSSGTGAMYFGGVSLIVGGVGAIIAWVLLIRRGAPSQ
ncbi:uncharacterized protein LOC124256686 [Haliotis rubra]|uniref:uncharacterized protein LOC124256686 n=1 Tax=Haliotis rubra TaxID=36100 RepID=UPI001EE54823|nr:uncharacterized protein LOC124256686 [Haliotis rubra]